MKPLLLALCVCTLPTPAPGQPTGSRATPRGRSAVPADSAEIHTLAVKDQQLFEDRRFQYLPGTTVTDPNPCAEQAGSLCFRWTSGWTSAPEAPQITAFRDTLLEQLDSLQRLDPGDGWILGQRVWYRGEAGQWRRALTDAGACGGAPPWWCAALQGLALHRLGRYREAEAAFTRALAGMPPKEAERWRIPDEVVSGGTARLLHHASPAAQDTLLARLWLLADPLYLVPGNDRETAHYARWTAATLHEGAANPHRVPWNGSMADLLLRHGPELAWTKIHRSWNVDMTDAVVGYNEPAGREFMPPTAAVEDPASATAAELTARDWRPKSLYQPVYAPVILPMDDQLAVFPRADSVVVVATAFVPRDTTESARDRRSRPWMAPGAAAGEAEAKGLFLMKPDGGEVEGSLRRGDGPRSFLLRAPAGRYVVSAEAWSPPGHVAGRRRQGLRADTLPPDVATLSDLLMLDPSPPEPASLATAATEALPRPLIHPGDTFRLLWELGGLGWHAESVRYAVTVERADAGLLRRLGSFLHVAAPDKPLSLAWSEPGPSEPEVLLRSLRLDLPELDPGPYRVRLEARLHGRAPLVSETVFEVSAK